ncbi:hypothetical protein TNCV_138931 [Trichonephila clavipes]|nr:hypothetical protein TNCV_138931 [Trichonephila clavipes]
MVFARTDTESLPSWTPWWVEARQDEVVFCAYESEYAAPVKGFVLPTLIVDQILQHTRIFLLVLPNNEMSNKSPFAVHKALIGIGGEPKSVKRLLSGDLLIEANSAIQTKSF